MLHVPLRALRLSYFVDNAKVQIVPALWQAVWCVDFYNIFLDTYKMQLVKVSGEILVLSAIQPIRNREILKPNNIMNVFTDKTID